MPYEEERAEKRYRALFDLSPFTIMTFSMSGFVTSCNPAMIDFSGYDPDDMIGKHFLKLDYLGKQAVRYGLDLLPKILRGEQPEPVEIPFTSRMGEPRVAWVSMRLIRFPDGRHEIMAIVEDITDEKKSRATANRFLAFKESATDGFVLLDKDLNILDSNSTWAQRIGAKGHVVGRNIVDLLAVSPELEERIEVYREVIRSGEPVELDRIKAPSGNGLIYNIKAFKVGDGVGLIVRDITRRVEYEEERYRLNEMLVGERLRAEHILELDRLKTEFMNTATHEIRTPLSSIQGYSELIWDSLKEGDLDQACEYFEVVDRNVKRLKILSDDLLDVQRLEAGRIRLDVRRVPVGDLFGELEGVFRPLIRGDSHTVVFDYPSDLLVRCDPMRLGQVLSNLVSNAVRYSPGGGVVRVSAVLGDGGVVFSVSDEGLGLSEADLGEVFKPFPDMTHHRVRHGTGLGLSICKGIVELHGGEIWAESEGLGKGSVFGFRVPL